MWCYRLAQDDFSHNEGMGVPEFVTCSDEMATNDLRNTSRVESVEAYLNGYLRKWLGVSKKHLKCISLL